MENKMENISNYEVKTFNTPKEYTEFLKDLIAEVSNKNEFNVFLHMIGDWRDDTTPFNDSYNIIEDRLYGILKSGLHLKNYSTINGTMNFLGSSFDEGIAERILKYEYYRNLENKASCIILIPKFITSNNKLFEYSSFDNVSFREKPNRLISAYRNNGGSEPDSHHYKCCLFDVIKEDRPLPKEYLLATQIINENEGKYSIVLPKTHLTQIPEEEAKKHLEIVSNLVEKKIEKHQTFELTELIVKQYKEEEKWINYLLDFEI